MTGIREGVPAIDEKPPARNCVSKISRRVIIELTFMKVNVQLR